MVLGRRSKFKDGNLLNQVIFNLINSPTINIHYIHNIDEKKVNNFKIY